MARLVTGLFKSKQVADAAVEALLRSGYREDEITMVLSSSGSGSVSASVEEQDLEASREANSKAEQGLVAGGVAGGAFGGLLAAAIAAGASWTVPGADFLIAGPLVAGVTGALVGGTTGSLLGSLVALGVAPERATAYHEDIQRGGIVLGIEAKNESQADELEKWLNELGATGVAQGQAPPDETVETVAETDTEKAPAVSGN